MRGYFVVNGLNASGATGPLRPPARPDNRVPGSRWGSAHPLERAGVALVLQIADLERGRTVEPSKSMIALENRAVRAPSLF